MDNLKYAMEKSYDYMTEEINSILSSTSYSVEEKHRLFYACGSCLHAILDLAERIDILDNDKKYISAFRFANNALKHDKNLFELTKQTGGMSFPITFPVAIPKKEIKWKKLDNNGKYEGQYNNYVEYLQDKSVIETCERVIGILLNYIGE